uniref:Uncharacterized protein n=1 Tax=Zea mays TaxID=4577 RepID=C0P6W8_MAIZE|nr:unknown [Zea mays]
MLTIVDFLRLQVVCTYQGMPGNDKIHLIFLEANQHLQISHCCCKCLMKTGVKNMSSHVAPAQIIHEMLA